MVAVRVLFQPRWTSPFTLNKDQSYDMHTHVLHSHGFSLPPAGRLWLCAYPLHVCTWIPMSSQTLQTLSFEVVHLCSHRKLGGVEGEERKTDPPNHRMSTDEELPSWRKKYLKTRHQIHLSYCSPRVRQQLGKHSGDQLPHLNNPFKNRENLMTCWGFCKVQTSIPTAPLPGTDIRVSRAGKENHNDDKEG